MTAEDVLGDLGGEDFDVVRADRVTREVARPDGSLATALDASCGSSAAVRAAVHVTLWS